MGIAESFVVLLVENFESSLQLKHEVFMFSTCPALNLFFKLSPGSCILFFYAAMLMWDILQNILPHFFLLQLNTVLQPTFQMCIELLHVRHDR